MMGTWPVCGYFPSLILVITPINAPLLIKASEFN